MIGALGYICYTRKFEYGAVLCVLVYILIRWYLEKLIYFYIENNYYSYSFVMRLVIALENFLGKHVLTDAI